MGKTRVFFKKIRDIKGTFHSNMGIIKHRNCMDLTEAEYIKRWQEYTEELYKKDPNGPDNPHGVITHLEPDILEHEVKCYLGSITMNKASGSDGILGELFQILKDDAALNMSANLENSAVATALEKVSFIPIPKKSMPKNAQPTTQLHSFHMLTKKCSKFSKLSFSSTK